MPPADSTKMSISGLLSTLANNDLRFEIIMNALIELLETKKLPDGTPLFTKEEIEQKIQKIQDETMQRMAISRPNSGLIVPGGSGLPS